MLTTSRRVIINASPRGRGSLTIPCCRDWQDDKCLTNVLWGISTLGIDWATHSCLKLLNIPELISKTLKGETLIKNICIAVKDSPFWGNSKKLKKGPCICPSMYTSLKQSSHVIVIAQKDQVFYLLQLKSGFPAKRCLRNDWRNSILVTGRYSDLS